MKKSSKGLICFTAIIIVLICIPFTIPAHYTIDNIEAYKENYPNTSDYRITLAFNGTGDNIEDARIITTCFNENNENISCNNAGVRDGLSHGMEYSLLFKADGNVSKILVEIYDGDGNFLSNATTTNIKEWVMKDSEDSVTFNSNYNENSSNYYNNLGSPGSYDYIFTNDALERYDWDGDGRLSQVEWDEWCYYEGFDSMSNCDLDDDGYCSRSEINQYSDEWGY